jgi:uncharacterized protein YukJ
MPLPDYGLLRGGVINVLPFQKIGDHYNIEVAATGQIYRIAVDVYSTLKGSPRFDPQDSNAVWDEDRLLMFYIDKQYSHPVLTTLLQTAEGFTSRSTLPDPLHLDYVRGQPALFPLGQMTVVPPKQTDNDGNDLNDDLNPWIQKAMNNPQAEIFVFGDFFNDTGSSNPDPHPYFNPDPQMGVHDVHMNQGDSGSEKKDNGPGQDGALFLRFIGGAPSPAETPANPRTELPLLSSTVPSNGLSPDTWVAMFFRFQTQSIDTDANGNPT